MVKLLAISVLVASALAHPHVVSTADSLSVRAAAVSNNPIVNLGYVSYRGITNTTSGITYYRGIPYALPPLGALRWRKPVPVDPLNLPVGPLMNATVIKPACFLSIPVSLAGISLPGYTDPPQGQSEDCLTLDVLVPTNPISKTLPVMVQIHGGGYTLGNAQTMPGDAMVHAANGKIIYVSIQYRLGIFGFLAGDSISQNGVLNAGILDQRAALDWVQQNIAAFGGDPSQVTVWGASAGGSSVTNHLISNGGNGTVPFSKAIAEYPWWTPMLNRTLQNNQYSVTLKLAGCTTLACLRLKSSADMALLGQKVANASYLTPGDAYGTFEFAPVIDGTYIKDFPDQEFKKGNFHKVPIMVDHTLYEGLLFSNQSQITQAEEEADAKILFPAAPQSFFTTLFSLYPLSAFPSVLYQRQTWFGDFIINCPTVQVAKAFTTATGSPNTTAVFKMQFNAGSLIHTASAPFLAAKDIGFPGVDNALATIMSSYWISFAVKGDPNPLRSANAPFWPSYRGGAQTLVVTPDAITAAADGDVGSRCDFWSANGVLVGN